MADEYTPPEIGKSEFHCPHCDVYAYQTWGQAASGGSYLGEEYQFNRCQSCGGYGFWVDGNLIYPSTPTAPLPAEDMPESIREDYEEARNIVDKSPRASAALLRLATEKLLESVDAEGSGPYQMIGDLVEKGLIDERVQQAYDSLRVYGNESVHPGTIDMSDDHTTAVRLFDLMNFIVRRTITDERFVQEMYSDIPDRKKEGVDQRDLN